MRRCFFCHQPIRKDQARDFHHVIPRRFFRQFPGEDPNIGNLAYSHASCHREAHKTLDRPNLPLMEFVAYMETVNWLYGVYAQSAAHSGD